MLSRVNSAADRAFLAGTAIAVWGAANAALAEGPSAYGVAVRNRDVARQLAGLRAASRVRLAEAGVAHVEADADPPSRGVELERTFGQTRVFPVP